MTKGELMKLIYTADELKSIDPSLPLGWDVNFRDDDRPDSYWFVMNYNDNCFGCLEDMRLMANYKGVSSDEIEQLAKENSFIRRK